MATFGGYETVRELHHRGFATVWTARPAGSSAPERFVVKAVEPLIDIVGKQQAEHETKIFLEGARAQQKVAASGAEHWAGVYECGQSPDGAYCVSDYHSRSLDKLVLGRVNLNIPSLHAIIDSVVKGLLELKEALGRPHGNLKPSNVLIAGEGDVTRSKVVLTDPFGGEVDAHEGESADLHAVGELIYQLVLHRPFREIGGWPVPASDEWARLGKKQQAEAWRQLCNDLLSPRRTVGTLTLDRVATRLEKLRAPKVRIGLRWAVAAAVVLVAAGAAAFVFRGKISDLFAPTKKVIPPPGDWKYWCLTYYEWFGRFRDELDAPARQLFGTDAHLENLVGRFKAFEQTRGALDPRKVPGVGSVNLTDLAKLPPEVNEKALVRVRLAVELVREVENTFTLRSGERCWPKLRGIDEASKSYAARGWNRPSQYLAVLAESVHPGPAKQIVPNVEKVFSAFSAVQEADKSWREIQESAKGIEASGQNSGDEILKGFPAFAQGYATSEPGRATMKDVEVLRDGLAELQGLTKELAEIAEQWCMKVHQECFIGAGDVHREFRRIRELTKGTYLGWASEVQDPKFRLDPSVNPFAQTLSDVAADVQNALEQVQKLEEHYPQKQGEDLQKQFDKPKSEVQNGQKLPCCRACEAKIKSQADEVRSHLEKLSKDLADRIAFLRAVPASPDPREPLSAQLTQVQAMINSILDEHKVERKELQAAVGKLGQAIQEPLELEWIQAHEAYILANGTLRSAAEELASLEERTRPLMPKKDPRLDLRIAMTGIEPRIVQLRQKLNDLGFAEEYQARLDEIRNREFLRLAWETGTEAQRNAIAKEAAAVKVMLDDMKPTVDQRLAVVGSLRGREKIAASGSKVVDEHWRKRCDELMAKHESPKELESKAGELEKRLKTLDADLPASFPEISPPGTWDRKVAAEVFSSRREETLRQAIEADMSPEDENWKALSQGFGNWRREIVTLASDLKAIEKHLDEAYALKDVPPSGRESLDAVHGRWEKEKVFQDFQSAQAVSKRVQLLRDIEKMDALGLIQQANRTDDLSPAFNAWRRLGGITAPKPWPDDIAGLKEEAKIREKLAAGIERRIEDESRKGTLRRRVDREGPRRWLACLTQLRQKQDVEGAMDLMGKFGVQVDQLPAWSRFDVLLYGLREKTLQFSEAEKRGEKVAEGLFKLRDEFVEAVGGLGGEVSNRPEIAAFLAELKKVARTEGTGDLTKVGPMTSLLAGWKAEPAQDGKRVTYSWQNGRHSLEFARVEPSGGVARGFYLCTTEVSLVLFVDMLEAARTTAQLKDQGLLAVDRGMDCPCPWDWPAGDGTEIRQQARWFVPRPLIVKVPYPSGLSPQRPSRAHPMQGISAQAAMYFAALAGCRLPSSAEWAAAYDAYEKGDPAVTWNLRDPTWQRQQDHMKNQREDAASWPDQWVFWPKGYSGQRRAGKDAVAVTGKDDGLLWFAAVASGAGATFRHLVGNVAEFTYEDPRRFEEAFKEPKDVSIAKVTSFLAQDDNVSVVGGSALSAPELWAEGSCDKAYRADSTASYSDVGVRPAFSAPTEPPASRMWALVRPSEYLTGDLFGGRPVPPD